MKLSALRRVLAVGLMAVATGFAIQATAVPVFTYTEVAGFGNPPGAATPALSIDYSSTPPGVTTASGPYTVGLALTDPNRPLAGVPCTAPCTTYQRMSWLTNTSPQSDLILTNPTAGQALPVGPWETITTLTQHNNIIPGPLTWSNQSIFGRLQIFDGATKVLDNTSEDQISFVETDNAGFTGAPGQVPDPTKCPQPDPLGSQCDDHFIFSPGSLGSVTFTAADGSKWQADFRLFNFVNAGFDPAHPDNGFVYTAENSTASLDVQMRLTPLQRQVAEPGTLSLLGIGLLGLGFLARRRRRV